MVMCVHISVSFNLVLFKLFDILSRVGNEKYLFHSISILLFLKKWKGLGSCTHLLYGQTSKVTLTDSIKLN